MGEPTESLVQSWFQYQVHELRFTQPQTGTYGDGAKPWSFSTGHKGDIVVLKKDTCTGVHSITPADYLLGQTYSAKMTLQEGGGETTGDEKGGVARVVGLATGKVNELTPGIYKICYATGRSEGDAQSDYKMLAKTVEILPPTATKPSVSMSSTVVLGQDIIVSWNSNVQLQTRLSQP